MHTIGMQPCDDYFVMRIAKNFRCGRAKSWGSSGWQHVLLREIGHA